VWQAATARADPHSPNVCVLCVHACVCVRAEKVGGVVVEACCVIELPFLGGRKKMGSTELFVLVEKEGL
jgi:hypothetical protein